MNPFAAHLFSGLILYSGLALMIATLLAGERWGTRQGNRLLTVLVWIMAIVSVSTAAVTWWGVSLFLVSLGLWSGRSWLSTRRVPRWVCVSAPIFLAAILMAMEAPWTIRPSLAMGRERSVVILGDSLSAGLGEGEGRPWPFQMRDAQQVTVHNLSMAGAITADALQQIKTTDHFPGLVVVELGGNDMLSGRPCAEFERDLDQILGYLREHQRTVVMLELPLLPGRNSWGVVQRRLAQKHRCTLIPKRLLVDVLAAPGATVDTLHLTQAGHQHFAEMVWSMIEPAIPSDSATPKP